MTRDHVSRVSDVPVPVPHNLVENAMAAWWRVWVYIIAAIAAICLLLSLLASSPVDPPTNRAVSVDYTIPTTSPVPIVAYWIEGDGAKVRVLEWTTTTGAQCVLADGELWCSESKGGSGR